jgi:ABC-2 type transport system permease protein
MLHVLAKEFNSFLDSLIAYIVMGAFLTGIGLLMWVFPETSVLDFGYADMEALFRLGPYVFIFLIPAITMRSFAEEKKSGTMEFLLTKPLSDWDIINGKFLACFLLVVVAILPTLIYYYSLYSLGNPQGNIDTPGVVGSYIGLILLGAAFCSIGVMASAITTNQIVSFILAAFLCFLMFYGFESLSLMEDLPDWMSSLRQLGIFYHYESLSKGLIDLRDIVYFISVIFLMLLITRVVMGSRSW